MSSQFLCFSRLQFSARPRDKSLSALSAGVSAVFKRQSFLLRFIREQRYLFTYLLPSKASLNTHALILQAVNKRVHTHMCVLGCVCALFQEKFTHIRCIHTYPHTHTQTKRPCECAAILESKSKHEDNQMARFRVRIVV